MPRMFDAMSCYYHCDIDVVILFYVLYNVILCFARSYRIYTSNGGDTEIRSEIALEAPCIRIGVTHTWACERMYIIWLQTPMTVANRQKRSADTRRLAHAQTRPAQCKYERVTYDLIYGSRFYGTRHATIIVMCALRFRMKLPPSMYCAICSFVPCATRGQMYNRRKERHGDAHKPERRQIRRGE